MTAYARSLLHACQVHPHPPNDDDVMHASEIAISHMSGCKYLCVSQMLLFA